MVGCVCVTPNTSVLSLSAAITPNHKHGHVQICLRLERPPAEMFRDLGFLTPGLVGTGCRLTVIANVRQGHAHVDGGGADEQVAQTCAPLQMAPGAVRRSGRNKYPVRFEVSDVLLCILTGLRW